MTIDNLKSKKVLILGLGREGLDSFKFIQKIFPDKKFGIADKAELKDLDANIQKLILNKGPVFHLGKNYLRALKKYDIIIKSPGIPPKVIVPFISKKQRITSQTDIFFENCTGKIIGVTGTKGKSTTTSLIYEILKQNRLKVHLIGNIGRPVLSFLFNAKPDDIYVYELSSHQLYNFKKSPHIAVFLNIYPEHLDYYENFKEYLKAKQNITRYQKSEDFIIFNPQNKEVRETAKISKAKKIPIRIENVGRTIKIKEIPLEGKFNLQNIEAAIIIGRIFGISNRDIVRVIKKFKPLEHRLELVGTYRGITFYNDSLATAPEATIGAINTFKGKVQTIMLGGFDRGIDYYSKLAKTVLENKIKNIILFPTTGEKIWKDICSQNRKRYFLPKAFFVNNMKDAVVLAYKYTSKGKICLLSPACASFGIFKNYKERGDLFKKYVKKLGKIS